MPVHLTIPNHPARQATAVLTMIMTKRRVTKPVFVGGVKVGGDADISVQSMTKTDTRDVKATVRQIHQLEAAGCEIIRSAVPDLEAAKAMAEIKRQIRIPLVADIHFHYQLALECAAGGVDCLRLNPGNLRNEEQVRQVVQAAHARLLPAYGSGEPAAQGRRGAGRRLQRG